MRRLSANTRRILFGAAALGLIALAVTLAWRGSARPLIFHHSAASAAGAVAALAAGVVASWAALICEAAWRQGAAYWRRLPEASLTGAEPRIVNAVFIFAVVAQLLLAAQCARWNRRAADDQADYLRVAGEVVDLHGGSWRLPEALIAGRFVEDNRHPLYVGMLAMQPTVASGVLLSECFDLLTTLSVACFAWRRFGGDVAATSAALLATNFALHFAAALVACETLLVFCTTLGWMALCLGWQRRPATAFLVGVVFGLAYLTKASAALLFAVVVLERLAALFRDRRRSAHALCAATMLLGFTLAAFPLLVRNVRVYGSTLHSFNTKLLFADSYEEGAGRPDLGLVENARRYRATHRLRDVVVHRLGVGSLWETFVLFRSLGPIPLDSSRVLPGFFLFLLAMVGLATDREDRLAGRFVLCWTVVFVLFFGWYQPIAAGDRFLLPLAPPLLISASAGLFRLLGAGLSSKSRRFAPAFVLLFLASALAAALIGQGPEAAFPH